MVVVGVYVHLVTGTIDCKDSGQHRGTKVEVGAKFDSTFTDVKTRSYGYSPRGTPETGNEDFTRGSPYKNEKRDGETETQYKVSIGGVKGKQAGLNKWDQTNEYLSRIVSKSVINDSWKIRTQDTSIILRHKFSFKLS